MTTLRLLPRRLASSRRLASLAASVAVFAVAGCSASRETATVVPSPPLPSAPVPEFIPDRPAPAPTATATPVADTVQTGRFDGGRMWTFESPPAAYFRETYGIPADTAWFRRARLGALRFADYCSASLVSASGLVLTNHHCARESIKDVERSGETLLKDGFIAAQQGDERRAADLFVDQLVGIRDVTSDVVRGARSGQTREQETDARAGRARDLEGRLTAEASRRDAGMRVQVVPLYSGARYSAYTFRRHTDVRLVAAPELDLGFFGGDPDNFTYPRYTLDFALFRVYSGGQPLRTTDHFRISTAGVTDGQAVFVVGNPGSTDRLSTVAQLEYERDVELPRQLRVLNSRLAILRAYVAANPGEVERYDLRNATFDVSNSQKSIAGQYAGLLDPSLLARKAAYERDLRASLDTSATLRAEFGSVLGEIADVQRTRLATRREADAFAFFASPPIDSPLLSRAILLTYIDLLRRNGQGGEAVGDVREEIRKTPYWPAALEREFLIARFGDLETALGRDDVTLRRLLGTGTKEAYVDSILSRTRLGDSLAVKGMSERGFAASNDAAVALGQSLFGLYLQQAQQAQNLAQTEDGLEAALARLRFRLVGDAIPPDASFSLRIADGRVAGYTYNGTTAPAWTTFYGMYDRHASNPGSPDWALPARWSTPPAGLDLATPLNLVTTADITGGNSGSPLLDANLNVVGLVFDSNVEALPNEYLYRETAGRSVAVDVRAILAALRHAYNAPRLADELQNGR